MGGVHATETDRAVHVLSSMSSTPKEPERRRQDKKEDGRNVCQKVSSLREFTPTRTARESVAGERCDHVANVPDFCVSQDTESVKMNR